jgi:ADP-heptose:LPS heptosyltransferase
LKTLALQLKRLGDVVLTTPALELLAREGEVTLAVSGAAAGLLPAIPQISGAIVFGKGQGWTPWQQTIWGRFDRVVDFTGSDRSALVTALARAKRRTTFTRAKSTWLRRLPYNDFIDSPVRDQHTIEHYARFAVPLNPNPNLNLNPPEQAPRLQVPTDALTKARAIAWDAPYAIIHPGTARLEKFWLPDRWAAVIEHLQRAHNLRCIITGGQAADESAHIAAITALLETKPLNLAGQLDLLTLTALVSEARIVVSVDTVLVHLAAAFQRPQVALFGPTNPFHWRPRHASARVLSAAHPEAPMREFEPRMKGAPMDRLSTEAVIHATDGLLFQ